MADLNSDFFSSPALESDDISVLVQSLLNTSNFPSSVPLHDSQRPPDPEIKRQFCGSAFSSSLCGGYGAILPAAEGIDELDSESEDKDASELPWKSGPSRSSSKRTRPAEIHNISEKRRRQRINEKMKALQKLIPNSNKTDRASMLDDAIEYLKQLQLQVQILALRNGSSLHTNYLPGFVNSSSRPNDHEVFFNMADGLPSSSRGRSSRSIDLNISRKTVLNPASTTFASSDQKIYLPVALETGSSAYPFPMEHSGFNQS